MTMGLAVESATPSGEPSFATKVDVILAEVGNTLKAKNEAYGNSALDPVRVFSNASPTEQLRVRIDDKLSRLMRGERTERVPEDTVTDLIGYLILLRIAEGQERQRVANANAAILDHGQQTD